MPDICFGAIDLVWQQSLREKGSGNFFLLGEALSRYRVDAVAAVTVGFLDDVSIDMPDASKRCRSLVGVRFNPFAGGAELLKNELKHGAARVRIRLRGEVVTLVAGQSSVAVSENARAVLPLRRAQVGIPRDPGVDVIADESGTSVSGI